MKEHWDKLSERERWMLVIGGAFFVIYLLYATIYSPLISALQQRAEQLIEKKETLAWMQTVRQQYVAKNSPKALHAGQLLTVLTDELKKTSFQSFSYRLQQTSSNDIQLSFAKVPYNLFLAWLWRINEHYTLAIKQWNVARTDAPGIVQLSMTFSVT